MIKGKKCVKCFNVFLLSQGPPGPAGPLGPMGIAGVRVSPAAHLRAVLYCPQVDLPVLYCGNLDLIVCVCVCVHFIYRDLQGKKDQPDPEAHRDQWCVQIIKILVFS